MDALPIQETNEVPYKSINDGVMHACGHDVHTTCVLGAAYLLSQIKDKLKHNVVLIFQPGEEKLPGGASIMINEGLLQKYKMDAIIAQHVHPPLECGKIGIRAGMYMASADELYIEIVGKGGHGALPHACVDPIVIAAEIICSLQKIVSRNAKATTPSVLTIGKINSVGGATNVIPDVVKLEGTFRTMDEDWRSVVHEKIKSYVNSLCKANGATAVVDIKKGYPFLKNDIILTNKVEAEVKGLLGDDNVTHLPIRMTSEDFSYYSQHMPTCFYRLGTGTVSYTHLTLPTIYSV